MNYLSIDIGGTNIKYGLLDHSGQLLARYSRKTPRTDKELFLQEVDKIIIENIAKVQGIAISVPGKVIPKSGTVYHGGSLPFLDGVNFKQLFEKKYHVPVGVENDGKAAALAELWLGSLRDIQNGAVVVLGTGVGGGIVVGGNLLRGIHAQAGELSFMNLGTKVDKLADLAGFAGSAVEMVKKCNVLLGLGESEDGRNVFRALEAKNTLVEEIFNKYCQTIAVIILNTQSVLDLQRYAISGGISAQPLLLEGIRKAYTEMYQQVPLLKANLVQPEIVAAVFKNDANLYGALYSLLLELNARQEERTTY